MEKITILEINAMLLIAKVEALKIKSQLPTSSSILKEVIVLIENIDDEIKQLNLEWLNMKYDN